MYKIYHKFLILLIIFILFGSFYLYFSNNLVSEASLISSLSKDIFSSEDETTNDIAFISSLNSLNNIKIDTDLFSNKAFIYLKNNAVKIEDNVVPGRLNPFSPVKQELSTNIVSSPVLTNSPINVKSTSVTLSGTVNNTSGLSGGYFEYGLTKNLGQKITQSTFSLIGAFVVDITGLTPKTVYFYRACVKMGTNMCGEIVSFETK